MCDQIQNLFLTEHSTQKQISYVSANQIFLNHYPRAHFYDIPEYRRCVMTFIVHSPESIMVLLFATTRSVVKSVKVRVVEVAERTN